MTAHRAWTALLLALVALALLQPAMAEDDDVRYDKIIYDERWTGEGATTTLDVSLKGVEVVEAFFNFTLIDDVDRSQADTFVFTVTNAVDGAVKQTLPGTTDQSGHLTVSLPFTVTAPPRWRVGVQCTSAGDLVAGPFVLTADDGNAWLLEVEYAYREEAPPDGDGGDGDGNGDGGGGVPMLVRVFQADLALVALASMAVAGLALRGRRPDGALVPAYVVAVLLLLDTFVALPVALVINSQENGALLYQGPLGPEWLGNLAVALFAVWVVPFVVPFRRVLTAPATRRALTRFVGASAARRADRLGRRATHDTLSHGALSSLLAGIGLGSAAIATAMLLL